MAGRWRDVADDGGLGIATQRRLQNAGQLGVAVGNVAAFAVEEIAGQKQQCTPGAYVTVRVI